MAFLYFAYGSNLWPPQMLGRCPSALRIGTARLDGWRTVYDKPSRDGSSKLNIVESPGDSVLGAVYEIDDEERSALDGAEDRYDPLGVTVSTDTGARLGVRTYRWTGVASEALPYDWYLSIAQAGAALHGLPESYYSNHLGSEVSGDPLAPGVRPATADDLPLMQSILSRAVAQGGDRYSIHPGDLAWWIFHADPRHSDGVSYWMQGDDGVLMVDADDSVIGAFARPGVSPIPMIEWAQRRLRGRGAVGWVADTDSELVAYLEGEGSEVVRTDYWYRWDLDTTPVPAPSLDAGWTIRNVEGEHEADNRRRASHAAFNSTMDESMHLDRYLRFMRSPVYEPTRDLVAIAPDGTIASFIVWWPDPSGIAQIEPFGTHPDFQRRGIGRALIHYALRQMRDAGMTTTRVMTWDKEDSTGFYEGVGFEVVGAARDWQPRS